MKKLRKKTITESKRVRYSHYSKTPKTQSLKLCFRLSHFKDKYCARFYVNCTALDVLLDLRGNMSAAGFMTGTSKWDFPGAFHFVGTIVSTIGELYTEI